MKPFSRFLYVLPALSFSVAVTALLYFAFPGALLKSPFERFVGFHVAAIALCGVVPSLFFIFFGLRVRWQRRMRSFASDRLAEVLTAQRLLAALRASARDGGHASLASALAAVLPYLEEAERMLNGVLPPARRKFFYGDLVASGVVGTISAHPAASFDLTDFACLGAAMAATAAAAGVLCRAGGIPLRTPETFSEKLESQMYGAFAALDVVRSNYLRRDLAVAA